jgi:tetratricopeptide (TPR) repeat protein
MNDILTEVNILSKNDDKALYGFILQQKTNHSNDVNFWLSLAVVIIQPPFGDEETGIFFIKKALSINHNNPIALIILAHVYEYQLGGINDMLLHQIKNLRTDSDEINSMLKYVASWSYRESKKYNPDEEERLLKESILFCDKHVWNYEHLAKLYFKQKRYIEVNNLLRKALNNIEKVYSDDDDYDITDIDEFINEAIKGVHLSESNFRFIKQDFVPNHIIIFYIIITPFLNFYRFIKKLFYV